MNTEQYLSQSARTVSPMTGGKTFDEKTMDLLHGAIGLSTEANKALDMLKKHIYYNKELDITNLVEECGDALWYIALILRTAGYSFEEIMQINIDKLRLRFPEKFEEGQAINRDAVKEREFLDIATSGLTEVSVGDVLMCDHIHLEDDSAVSSIIGLNAGHKLKVTHEEGIQFSENIGYFKPITLLNMNTGYEFHARAGRLIKTKFGDNYAIYNKVNKTVDKV